LSFSSNILLLQFCLSLSNFLLVKCSPFLIFPFYSLSLSLIHKYYGRLENFLMCVRSNLMASSRHFQPNLLLPLSCPPSKGIFSKRPPPPLQHHFCLGSFSMAPLTSLPRVFSLHDPLSHHPLWGFLFMEPFHIKYFGVFSSWRPFISHPLRFTLSWPPFISHPHRFTLHGPFQIISSGVFSSWTSFSHQFLWGFSSWPPFHIATLDPGIFRHDPPPPPVQNTTGTFHHGSPFKVRCYLSSLPPFTSP
jgi:hypothetical protein